MSDPILPSGYKYDQFLLSGYVRDGGYFHEPYKTNDDPTRLHALAKAIRDCRKGVDEDGVPRNSVQYASLYPHLSAFANLFPEVELTTGGADDKGAVLRNNVKDMKAGKAPTIICIYLAWMCCEYSERAKKLYKEVDLEFRPFTDKHPLAKSDDLDEKVPSLLADSSFDVALEELKLAISSVGTDLLPTKKLRSHTLGISAVVAAFALMVIGLNLYELNLLEGWLEEQSTDWPIENASGNVLPVRLGLLETELASESDEHRLSNLLSALAVLQLLVNQGDALANAKAATDASPGNRIAWERLGFVHFARGEEGQGKYALDRAAALSPYQKRTGLDVVTENPWIFGFGSQKDLELTVAERDDLWNALNSVPDSFVRDMTIVSASIYGLVVFDDASFAERMWSRTSSCKEHLEYVLRAYCKNVYAMKLDEEGDEEAAVRMWTEVSEDARQDGQLAAAVFADAQLARHLNAGGAITWPQALKIITSASEDARQLGDSRTLFHMLWQLADIQFESAQDPTAALNSLREAADLVDGFNLRQWQLQSFLQFQALVEYQVGSSAKAVDICRKVLPTRTADTRGLLWRKAVWSYGCAKYHLKIGNKGRADDLHEEARLMFSQYVEMLKPTVELSASISPYERGATFRNMWAITRLNYYGLYDISDQIHLIEVREFLGLSETLQDLYRPYFIRVIERRLDTLFRQNVYLSNAGYEIPETNRNIQKDSLKLLEEEVQKYLALNEEISKDWKGEDITEIKFRFADMFGPDDEAFRLFKAVWNNKFMALYERVMADVELYAPPSGAFEVLFDDDPPDFSSEQLSAARKFWFDVISSLERDHHPWVDSGNGGVSHEFWDWADFIRLRHEYLRDANSIALPYVTGVFAEIAAEQDFPWANSARLMEAAQDSFSFAFERLDSETPTEVRDSFLTKYHMATIKYVEFVDGTRGAARKRGTREHLWALYQAMMSARNIKAITLALEFLERFRQLHNEIVGPCAACDEWQGNIASTDFGLSSVGAYGAMRREILGLASEQNEALADEAQWSNSIQ